MIIETAHYWAKPGTEATVLDVRAALLSVRRSLGLDDGVLLRKIGQSDGPTLTWVNRYPTVEAMARDIAVRSTSPEFLTLCQQMDGVLEHFERRIDEEVILGPQAVDPASRHNNTQSL